jgi:hypothetical protein
MNPATLPGIVAPELFDKRDSNDAAVPPDDLTLRTVVVSILRRLPARQVSE